MTSSAWWKAKKALDKPRAAVAGSWRLGLSVAILSVLRVVRSFSNHRLLFGRIWLRPIRFNADYFQACSSRCLSVTVELRRFNFDIHLCLGAQLRQVRPIVPAPFSTRSFYLKRAIIISHSTLEPHHNSDICLSVLGPARLSPCSRASPMSSLHHVPIPCFGVAYRCLRLIGPPHDSGLSLSFLSFNVSAGARKTRG